MPSALLRPCANPGGCHELVESGRCKAHATEQDAARGSSAERGYDGYWRRFIIWFRHQLIAKGIVPVCGAALSGGPSMADSQCRAQGLLNDHDLHLDHDPPLRPDERQDRRAVCNPLRVGFLCASCHARKTLRERQMGLV